jgi:peroxiredoxin
VALQSALPEITGAGASLVAISPQLPSFNAELVRQRHLTFEILSDAGNRVAEQFGVKFAMPAYLKELYLAFPNDLAKVNGDDSWTLPMPARFIIDSRSVIRYAESDPDYTTRPEPEHTLAALRALR